MAIHKPVLPTEVLKLLQVKEGGRYIDATLGEGGHALEVANRGGLVLGIEKDPEILEEARQRLEGKVKVVRGNFADIDQIAKTRKFDGADGILFDLGVSSWQLERSGRGFSFQKDEPLDMRADPSLKVTAADLLNGLTKHELEKLLQNLGEEERARELARAIVRARTLKPFETTEDLVLVVEEVKGGKGKKRIHPATKVFQALRIAVNDEINALRSALPRAFGVLKTGGRLAVVAFHSLEDREVKGFFSEAQARELGRVVTKKPVRPTPQELKENPRSRSAKLRVLERI
ncbi:16S rRNA (cytosine(1402)-N(4))-methyltransferase RsmH [Candidatus Saccharibacteria bacterium]|nr:16S rRNA (cytosine(1402)-N(4))-methyltransferase RsmH [Candidatus Saccharibacteria bacterium]